MLPVVNFAHYVMESQDLLSPADEIVRTAKRQNVGLIVVVSQ